MQSLASTLVTGLSHNPASDAPDNYRDWLEYFYPSHVDHFAEHHNTIWQWVDSIESGQPVDPMIAILARGGGKSTTAELAVSYVAAKRARRYILYVRATQDQADKSVDNIAALLESPLFAQNYPAASQRRVGKYGQSKGWRRNRLSTDSGLTVDAYGLDTAMRGTKVEENRPDMIILDDVDSKHDSMGTTKKKIETITTSILPAGSPDLVVFGIQNLLISTGFFAQLAYGQADFLTNATIVGPVPAIDNLEYERVQREDGKYEYKIIDGTPTWEGQNIEVCERQISLWGLNSFLVEAQHDVDVTKDGTYTDVTFRRVPEESVPFLRRRVCWVDPAVSDSDDSDAMGIQVDGICEEGTIYRLFSWERRTSPKNAIRQALLKSYELDCNEVGFETDQGGALWRDQFYAVYKEMVDAGELPTDWIRPSFRSAKAGSIGSKRHRHNMMRTAYDRGELVHVEGSHVLLENALKRFPIHKPFDLADAAFWSWRSLAAGSRVWVRGASS